MESGSHHPRRHGARRRRWFAVGSLPAIGIALILITGCGPTPRVARAHRVAIRAMRYEPAVVVAAPGDTVRWTNLDLVPHTVTAGAGAFDSGSLPPDSSWAMVLGRGGDRDYACLYHPGMKGSVVVGP